jgi:hypothetical protein
VEGKAQKASKDTQKTNKKEQKNRIPQESPPGSTRVLRVLGLGANMQRTEENKGFKYNQGKRGTGANNNGDQGKTKGQKAQWGHLVTKNWNNPGQILTGYEYFRHCIPYIIFYFQFNVITYVVLVYNCSVLCHVF